MRSPPASVLVRQYGIWALPYEAKLLWISQLDWDWSVNTL